MGKITHEAMRPFAPAPWLWYLLVIKDSSINVSHCSMTYTSPEITVYYKVLSYLLASLVYIVRIAFVACLGS